MYKPYLVKCDVCGKEVARSNRHHFKCGTCRGTCYPLEYNKMRKILINETSKCNICGDNKNLVIHHLDGNRNNNKKINLEVRCSQCHQSKHRKKEAEHIEIRWGTFGKRLVYAQ